MRAFEDHPTPDIGAPRDRRLDPEWERAYADLWREPPREPEPSAKSSRLPLVAAIVAILLGAMALIGLRDKIVRVAPPMSALYSAVGLKVRPAGLELRGVSSKIVAEGSHKTLTVEGEIVNLRREANNVPPVALAVRGADGRARHAWTAPAPKARLEAGEKATFRARLVSPPADGVEVLARFAGLGANSSR